MRQYHIACDTEDIGEYVLMPGDPGRCERIAERFDNPRHVVSNREFTTWTGTLDGVKVSATSTGIGGPSTAIAVEELHKIGAHTFIRLGTCGSIQPGLKFADLIVAQGAVRDEGTSLQYAPLSFPAVASVDVTSALAAAAEDLGHRHHTGVVQSRDAFYAEMEPKRMPQEYALLAAALASRRAGVLVAEMECATLFVVASVLRARAGSVLVSVNETPIPDDMPHPTEIPLDPLIDTAVGAVRKLIAQGPYTRTI